MRIRSLVEVGYPDNLKPLNPKPIVWRTLNPPCAHEPSKPETPNPKPETLNPKPEDDTPTRATTRTRASASFARAAGRGLELWTRIGV